MNQVLDPHPTSSLEERYRDLLLRAVAWMEARMEDDEKRESGCDLVDEIHRALYGEKKGSS